MTKKEKISRPKGSKRVLINNIFNIFKENFTRYSLIVIGLLSILLYERFGLWGIVISSIATAIFILLLNLGMYIYLVKEGFKLLWGKYPEEIKKGEKLRKIKIIWRKKNE